MTTLRPAIISSVILVCMCTHCSSAGTEATATTASAGTSSAAAGGAQTAGGGSGGSSAGTAPTNLIVDQLTLDDAGCLPRPLATIQDESGTAVAPCWIIEMSQDTPCSCESSRGRETPEAYVPPLILDKAEQNSLCNGDGTPTCASACLCAITQLDGIDSMACRNDLVLPDGLSGFCYVNADLGNPDLVSTCPSMNAGRLRFAGQGSPAPDARVFIACRSVSLIP